MFNEIRIEKKITPIIDNSELISESDKEVIKIDFNDSCFIREWRSDDLPKTELYRIEKVLIQEGKTFAKNEPILIVSGTLHGTGNFIIKLQFGGQVKSITEKERFSLNETILKVQKFSSDNVIESKIIDERFEEVDDTEIAKIVDDFTDEWTIEFVKVLSQKTAYLKIYDTNSAYTYLGFSFTNHNGYSYLDIISTMDSFSLSRGDEIILLFEDKVRFNIKFNKPGAGSKGYRHNSFPLNVELLNLFLFKRLIKIKVVSVRKNLYTVCSFEHSQNWNSIESLCPQYTNSIIGQFALRLMTYKFIESNKNNNG